jgi:dsDNA-specific endonuclease/ATPase MutS2
MILAAQLAQEDEHKEKSKELFKASHIQDFLDSIRVSLVDHGMIRRSQTLLGSTVGSIDTPYQWIVEQINGYEDLTNTLKQKRKELKLQMDKAQEDNWNELQQNIKEIFQSVQGKVNYFAEHNWECNQSQLGNEWKNFLKSQSVEERLKSSVEKASLNFQHNIQEALEEIGNELEIISQLRWGNFDFSRHDPGFFDKNWVRITGMVLTGVGGLLLLFFPPFGMMALAGGILSFAADLFKSRSQKRHEAVTKITQFLKPQLQEWEEKVLKETYKDYKKYCESIESNVDKYFEVLIQGLEEIAAQLRPTQEFLVKVINYLNRAYAKRIINWATDHSEPLTDISINKVILRVNRDFGKRMQIQTMFPVSLTKSQEEISTVLQETISIQPITS